MCKISIRLLHVCTVVRDVIIELLFLMMFMNNFYYQYQKCSYVVSEPLPLAKYEEIEACLIVRVHGKTVLVFFIVLGSDLLENSRY